MTVSLWEFTNTDITNRLVTYGTTVPISQFGYVDVVNATVSATNLAQAIKSSYIVNGATAYWTTWRFDPSGQMFFYTWGSNDNRGNQAGGPALTETAEDNIVLALRMIYADTTDANHHRTAQWDFNDLDESDEDPPYLFSAASVTAAGEENDSELRNALMGAASVQVIIFDRTTTGIDETNLTWTSPTINLTGGSLTVGTTSITAGTVSLVNPASLSLTGGSVTVGTTSIAASGSVTLTSPSSLSLTGGSITVASPTITAGSVGLRDPPDLNLAGGTLTVGPTSIAASGSVSLATASSLQLTGGSLTVTSPTITAGTVTLTSPASLQLTGGSITAANASIAVSSAAVTLTDPLALSDFATPSGRTLVFAGLIERGADNSTNLMYRPDQSVGSLISGNLNLEDGYPVTVIRNFSSTVFQLNDAPDPDDFSAYMGSGGAGNDLRIHIQDEDGVASFDVASTTVFQATPNYVRWTVPTAFSTVVQRIAAGDRFILAATRAAASILNLTGGSITAGATSIAASGSVTLTNPANLNLTGGNITAASASIAASGSVALIDARLDLTGGTLTVGPTSIAASGSVSLTSPTALSLTGGSLTVGPTSIAASGSVGLASISRLNLTGGSLTVGPTSIAASGSVTLTSSRLNLTGGSITVGSTSIASTGGVTLATASKLNLTGGSLTVASPTITVGTVRLVDPPPAVAHRAQPNRQWPLSVSIRTRAGKSPPMHGIEAQVSSYAWTARGGPQNATIQIAGADRALATTLDWAGHDVIISDAAGPVWWGYIEKVTLSDGSWIVDSSIERQYNAIRTHAMPYATTPPGTWVENAANISRYGRRELSLLLSTGFEAPTEAQLRDLLNPYTGSHQGFEHSRTGRLGATLHCRGYDALLDWQYTPRFTAGQYGNVAKQSSNIWTPSAFSDQTIEWEWAQYADFLMERAGTSRLTAPPAYNQYLSRVRWFRWRRSFSGSNVSVLARIRAATGQGSTPGATIIGKNRNELNFTVPSTSSLVTVEMDWSSFDVLLPQRWYFTYRQSFNYGGFAQATSSYWPNSFTRLWTSQNGGSWVAHGGQLNFDFYTRLPVAALIEEIMRGHSQVNLIGLHPSVRQLHEAYFPGTRKIGELVKELSEFDDLHYYVTADRQMRLYRPTTDPANPIDVNADGRIPSRRPGDISFVGQWLRYKGAAALCTSARYNARAGNLDLSMQGVPSAGELRQQLRS